MLVNGKHYRTIWFDNNKVKIINQLLLPHKFKITTLKTVKDVANAIIDMSVRGAPALGAAGAYGMALGVSRGDDIHQTAEILRDTRPTANNLFRGIDHVLESIEHINVSHKKIYALNAANEYATHSVNACKKIGEFGASLIKDDYRIATHCNAGWLACVDWGTALAPIYIAKRQEKKLFVYVDETRPRLQGAKLTSWELKHEDIDHCIITDNATGHYMRERAIDIVIVGADRVTRNGDAVNKIGTYGKAVLAKENKIPFYVAAPISTFDFSLEKGDDVKIEQRDEDEVLMIGKEKITPEGIKAKNPAFDVTPARFITGFITEKGVYKPGAVSHILKK